MRKWSTLSAGLGDAKPDASFPSSRGGGGPCNLVGVAQILQEEGSAVKPKSLVGASQAAGAVVALAAWLVLPRQDTPRGGQRRKTKFLSWSFPGANT